MANVGLDFNQLPEDVRLKLAELDLELSEGKLIFITFCFVPVKDESPSFPRTAEENSATVSGVSLCHSACTAVRMDERRQTKAMAIISSLSISIDTSEAWDY